MRASAAEYLSVVDLYNSATGVWSTAQLSVPRCALAATSVGNVAIFAGGLTNSGALLRESTRVWIVTSVCVLFTVSLFTQLLALTRATADVGSNAVDLYSSSTGAWSTARLSAGRSYLAAASVGNVALFAGGLGASALVCREAEGVGVVTVTCALSVCVFCSIALLFTL